MADVKGRHATGDPTGDPTGDRVDGRRERSRRTRRAIVRAATDLFVDRGYGATTIAQI